MFNKTLCKINSEATKSGQSSGSDSDATETDPHSPKRVVFDLEALLYDLHPEAVSENQPWQVGT